MPKSVSGAVGFSWISDDRKSVEVNSLALEDILKASVKADQT